MYTIVHSVFEISSEVARTFTSCIVRAIARRGIRRYAAEVAQGLRRPLLAGR